MFSLLINILARLCDFRIWTMTHICYIILSSEQIAGEHLIAAKTREF